eukprot:jgi/Hompol1/1348/HPOL_001088-RA
MRKTHKKSSYYRDYFGGFDFGDRKKRKRDIEQEERPAIPKCISCSREFTDFDIMRLTDPDPALVFPKHTFPNGFTLRPQCTPQDAAVVATLSQASSNDTQSTNISSSHSLSQTIVQIHGAYGVDQKLLSHLSCPRCLRHSMIFETKWPNRVLAALHTQTHSNSGEEGSEISEICGDGVNLSRLRFKNGRAKLWNGDRLGQQLSQAAREAKSQARTLGKNDPDDAASGFGDEFVAQPNYSGPKLFGKARVVVSKLSALARGDISKLVKHPVTDCTPPHVMIAPPSASPAVSSSRRSSRGDVQPIVSDDVVEELDQDQTVNASPENVGGQAVINGDRMMAVFAYTGDPSAKFWWPAVVIPRSEIDSSMPKREDDDAILVIYLECDRRYYTWCPPSELRVFDPEQEPYLTFSKQPSFLADSGHKKVLEFWKTGEIPVRSRWKRYGKGQRTPRLSLALSTTSTMADQANEEASNGDIEM